MSNPYSSPEMPTHPTMPMGGLEKKPPGAFTAITIICLVLGIMGLLGFCGNVIGLGFQSFLIEMVDKMPDDDPNKKIQKANLEFQQSMMIPVIIIAVFGLISSAGLTMGAIGAMNRKQSMHGLFRVSLYVAAAYAVIMLAWSIWNVFVQMGLMDEMLADADPQAAQVVQTGFYIGLAIGIGFALIWGLGWMAFYLWSASYINRPEIKTLFNK